MPNLSNPPAIMRILRKLRLSCLALTLVGMHAQTGPAAAQAIAFQHENLSDLRGLLNVFHMFREACIQRPTTVDLPERIKPAGYKVVTFDEFLWGKDSDVRESHVSTLDKIAILSKTGQEQSDWDGGHPYVTYHMPKPDAPDGGCSVTWQRPWDYEGDQSDLALRMFGVMDAQISYHLRAVLNSRPPNMFQPQGYFGGTSAWFTWCFEGALCDFSVLFNFEPKKGISVTITRERVSR